MESGIGTVWLFVEPDRDYLPEEMHIFIQHWKPSLHEFSKMSEIVVPSSADVNKLKDEVCIEYLSYSKVKSHASI